MQFKNKTFIVGDLAVVSGTKSKGSICYIGEIIDKSNVIYIGITVGDTTTQNMVDDHTHNNNKIGKIIYFNPTRQQKGLMIEKSKIIKLFRGINNKHLSRKWKINDRVYIKSIKCKGYIKSMWLKPPKYIIKNVLNRKSSQNTKNVKKKIGINYYGILLDKELGNNPNKSNKYFNCPDNTDYYCKSKFVSDIPNQKLSLFNKELIISYWYKQTFIPDDLVLLISTFCPSKDGHLRIKKGVTYKLPEECFHENDYYEYDSIKLGKLSKLTSSYIVIKCFGDMILGKHSVIDVSGTSNEYESSNNRKCNIGGGGSVDMYNHKKKQLLPDDFLYYKLNVSGGGAGHVTVGTQGFSVSASDWQYTGKTMIYVSKIPRWGYGEIYGNIDIEKTGNKLYFGSCGGTGSHSDKKGGKGGGIIKIICFGNITINKNAKILANGADGMGEFGYGGGGSGGTIYIQCASLTNNGKISATGGNKTKQLPYNIGGNPSIGGDGRIIIKTNNVLKKGGINPVPLFFPI